MRHEILTNIKIASHSTCFPPFLLTALLMSWPERDWRDGIDLIQNCLGMNMNTNMVVKILLLELQATL